MRMSIWSSLCLFFLVSNTSQIELNPSTSYDGTDFVRWSEDDWLESRFPIKAKFIFNHRYYEQMLIRSRMNEWSLELSFGNASRLNRVWTVFHLYLGRNQFYLNNSYQVSTKNLCRPPIISPLTNDSSVRIPELSKMDERIAQYYVNDGFFRTINYIHCTLNERRRDPLLHIQIEVYLVTNRDLQSLLYIEMSDPTRMSLADYQARVFIHGHQSNFKFNFNLFSLTNSTDSNVSTTYMIKLYNQTRSFSNSTSNRTVDVLIFLINLVFIHIFSS